MNGIRFQRRLRTYRTRECLARASVKAVLACCLMAAVAPLSHRSATGTHIAPPAPLILHIARAPGGISP